MASTQPKKNVKTSYRGNKKPSMAARKKAAQTAALQNQKTTVKTPTISFYRISRMAADTLGVVLIFSGALFLFSLKYTDMNSITEWCFRYARLYAGKSAILPGVLSVFFGIWLIILRRIKKPFSFSWKVFAFFTLVYGYVLVVIQHIANTTSPFTSPDQSGGILADAIDKKLTSALGATGSAIIYGFVAILILMVTWKWLSKRIPAGLRKIPGFILQLPKKLRSLFIFAPKITQTTEPGFSEETDDTPFSEPRSDSASVRIDKETLLVNSKEKTNQKTNPAKKNQAEPVIGNEQKKQKIDTKIPETESPVNIIKTTFKPTLFSGSGIKKQNSAEETNELSDSWRLPETDEILDPLKIRQSISPDDNFIQGQVQKIEHVLDAFDAPGKVVDIQCGPTFTQYGIEPGFLERADRKTRVRVKQIETLKKDLEMALSVKQLTIEAPIPNKTFIGLQVQNKVRIPVTLREVIESDVFKKSRKGLGIALGKDINGAVYAADLTRMPHLLIAGATGSGKSVCLNAILVCLLLHYTPEQLKLVLIDPKRVELTGYNGIPHLITPVVTDVEQVGNVLQWVLREMDMRNLHFMQAGVRNIQDYNQKNPNKVLPYLVVVIDELANLMMEAASDIESSITRLAQTARAMGIHLVVATQRPSRDVLTGTIKGNLPSRIAFAVATNVDSHVILDRTGAENLFGKGDMYFMSAEDSNLKRLQCVYVSDDEIKKLVDYWRKNPRIGDEPSRESLTGITPTTVKQPPLIKQGVLTQLPLLNEESPSVKKGDDPLLEEAIAMVRKHGRASANMLVSRLSIGFTRANKLLSQMEDMGIISAPNSNPAIPREILDYGENGAPVDD